MLTTQNSFGDHRVVDIGGIVDFDTKLGLEFETGPWTLRMALCQLPDPWTEGTFLPSPTTKSALSLALWMQCLWLPHEHGLPAASGLIISAVVAGTS